MTRTTSITITDARDIDGDPYEASDRAVQELRRALAAAQVAANVAFILTRNAYMQANLDEGAPPDGRSFEQTDIGKRADQIRLVTARVREAGDKLGTPRPQ